LAVVVVQDKNTEHIRTCMFDAYFDTPSHTVILETLRKYRMILIHLSKLLIEIN